MESKEMSSESYVGGTRMLPKDVIQNILMCLSLRDAVRTSILSRAWRYEWSTLPSLNFDEDIFELTGDENKEELSRKFVKIVYQVLLLHRGPIHEFRLSLPFLVKSFDIDRWIIFLSRNGIRKLTLDIWNIEVYKLPSCFFFCEDITHLMLYNIEFNSPSSFKGFSKLTELDLRLVDITEDGLRILLSLCMDLKRLILIDIFGCTSFKVCAKELVSFVIEGEFEDLHFESTPLLADAYLNFSYEPSDEFVASIKCCRIVEVFGCLPSIERLELVNHTLQILAVGDIPVSLPVVCPLKQLSLYINFEAGQQLLAALCIFRSSPLLQKLNIEALYGEDTGGGSASNFWQEQEDFNCKFTHLRNVEVTKFIGSTTQLKLVEYIAGNAPLLEVLQIKFAKNIPDELKVFRELVRFRRCSAKAEIIVAA